MVLVDVVSHEREALAVGLEKVAETACCELGRGEPLQVVCRKAHQEVEQLVVVLFDRLDAWGSELDVLGFVDERVVHTILNPTLFRWLSY